MYKFNYSTGDFLSIAREEGLGHAIRNDWYRTKNDMTNLAFNLGEKALFSTAVIIVMPILAYQCFKMIRDITKREMRAKKQGLEGLAAHDL